MYEDYTDFVQPEDLTTRMTLDEHFADPLERSERGLDKREDIDVRRAVLNAMFAAHGGGEWWEWIAGTEPLMQSGGIALVRDDRIVWATMTWIS